MHLSLTLMELLHLFAEGEQSKLSESFLLAGLTFLGEIECSPSQLVRPLNRIVRGRTNRNSTVILYG